ncbi:MAG: YjgN family protein [Gammaproteobacteria bacterium]
MDTLTKKDAGQFEFLGSTGEFFRIWIVNVMLTALTLGIYSAWAKVRTRRYFYNNTLLLNAPFDYLADPVKILKGRLIAFALFLIYTFSSLISPLMQTVLSLILIPLVPWIVIKALNFNLYNTAYRHIRFGFDGSYAKALGTFIGLALVTALTAGLAYPYFNRARKKFIIDHSRFGTSRFEMDAGVAPFYRVYLRAFLAFAAAMIIMAAFLRIVGPYPIADAKAAAYGMSPIVIAFIVFIFFYSYIDANLTNLVVNHTSLHTHTFTSTLNTGRIFWLYLTNMMAIVLSCGLLIPWAMIRTARYRISCIRACPDIDFADFVAAQAQHADAIGEEVGDIFDIDFGL